MSSTVRRRAWSSLVECTTGRSRVSNLTSLSGRKPNFFSLWLLISLGGRVGKPCRIIHEDSPIGESADLYSLKYGTPVIVLAGGVQGLTGNRPSPVALNGLTAGLTNYPEQPTKANRPMRDVSAGKQATQTVVY